MNGTVYIVKHHICMERKGWIDRTRGTSMMLILLFHTSMYYAGSDIPTYSMYVENALAMFFFISGYLFMPNCTEQVIEKNGWCAQSAIPDTRRKLKSILQKLITPYLIYTPTIAVLKAFVHGTTIDPLDIIERILSGEASWFVSSLIVAEVLFMAIVLTSRGKLLITAILCTLPCMAVAYDTDITPLSILNVSFIALVFLFIGHAFRRCEHVIDNMHAASYIPLFLLLVIIKVYEYANGINMTFYVIQIDSFPLFFTDTVLSSLCLVWLCKRLPSIKMVEYIGSHSLIYYFISGGVPLIVGRLMPQYTEGDYHLIAIAFIIVCLCSTAIVWAIYKWLPWTTGKAPLPFVERWWKSR